jgi:hypothetical protein
VKIGIVKKALRLEVSSGSFILIRAGFPRGTRGEFGAVRDEVKIVMECKKGILTIFPAVAG